MKYLSPFLLIILRVINANPVPGDLGNVTDSDLSPDESILTADDSVPSDSVPEAKYLIALLHPTLHTTALMTVQPRK